ncbi:MAG: sulfatase-like hydrolase/transferase, partial [Verrucomicrobiae bacterium]|nr:sulfatase-like hydrolase/transferase [Verrucomicrobiae bacterium]
KYLEKYEVGYEAIRNARFAKQKALGIVKPGTRLSPIFEEASTDDRKTMDRKMAVYAAQVDRLDQNVGRLVQGLKELGLFENTAILFLSDNGAASAEVDWPLNGGPRGEIGTNDSFVSYGKHWANVSNTPFRKYKAQEQEGGIASPLIFHWPNGLRKTGIKTRQLVHIVDIVPTILEISGSTYPKFFKGHPITPFQGESFAKVLKGETLNAKRSIFWEHEGNCGVREGDWKAVRLHNQPWELYDLSKDPTELNDLATLKPEKLERLLKAYQKWTKENGVMDWPLKKK